MPNTKAPQDERLIFLDRDGTIIVERHYLRDPAEVALELHAAEGLRMLSDAGFRLVVVSNQSGVGKGRLTFTDVVSVNRRVDELLRLDGVVVSGWYFCPHDSEDNCHCRKPADGMIRQAVADYTVSLPDCFMIGDKSSDLQLANNTGMRGILVATGYGSTAENRLAARKLGFPVCSSIKEAAGWILDRVQHQLPDTP